MPDKEALLRDLEAARTKYRDLLAKAVELEIPGVVDSVSSWCSPGQKCNTGDDLVRRT